MTKNNLYYQPLPQPIFEEVKQACIKVWSEYEEPYRSEKIDRIKDITNIEDNGMYMVAMFDSRNQMKLADLLSKAARTEIRNRIFAGGGDLATIVF